MTFKDMLNKCIKFGGALCIVLLFLLVFGYACPIERVIGIPCPGCNMMTSLYWLFKGNLSLSIYYHMMLIPTIVILLICMYCTYKKNYRLRTMFLSLWLIIMLIYYIYRMITIFPSPPMAYRVDSVFGKLIRGIYR